MDRVVIHGSCEVRAEEVANVAAAAPEFLAAVEREEGLVAYDLSWDIRNPNVLHLLEHWQSEDAYRVHTDQPHVHAWAQLMKGVAVAPLAAVKSRATAL